MNTLNRWWSVDDFTSTVEAAEAHAALHGEPEPVEDWPTAADLEADEREADDE